VGITRSVVHALGALGRPAPSEAVLRHSIGPPLRETFAEMLETTDAALVERAVVLYRERYSTVGLFENEVYPGVSEALARFRSAGHRMWVVTSKPHVFARRILEHFDLLHFFAGVYGCELDGAFSDKGDLIAHALATEALVASDTWMIGDRMHDVRGAKRNGLTAVGVLWGYGSEEELREAGPAHLLNALDQLRVLLAAVPRTIGQA
jgi:phosphoglycolate phosphatase